MDEGIGGFFFGGFVTTLILIWVILEMQPEIKQEELYRFCLVKNIPLQECVIPAKPYKKDEANG